MMMGRILVVGCLTGGVLLLAGCGREMSDEEKKATVQASGLKILDLAEGHGDPVRSGDVVHVNYTGWFASDGTQFDSSSKMGRPLTVKVGEGQVIKGWDEGLVGMKASGKRKLFIPSNLAYGATGRPPTIPPDADLVFEIDLLGIVTVDKEDLVVGTGPEVKRDDVVSILFTGTVKLTGKEYESHLDRTNPDRFQLGTGKRIKGLELGLLGMKPGGKRQLIIPADLAYGPGGQLQKGVPPNSDLILEVELLSIN